MSFLHVLCVSVCDQLVGQFDVVVNCTGLGSQQLLSDSKMVPNRGHIVTVSHYSHIEWSSDISEICKWNFVSKLVELFKINSSVFICKYTSLNSRH